MNNEGNLVCFNGNLYFIRANKLLKNGIYMNCQIISRKKHLFYKNMEYFHGKGDFERTRLSNYLLITCICVKENTRCVYRE
jgi:hypothetical protein